MDCIICKNDKQEEDFNEEHVFPESIGGKYKIRTVCKECNSHFGETIDNKFINSGVIRALNHILNIENKNGKVVPYFKDIIVDPKNNSIRLKTFFDNKGNLKDTEFETTVQDTIVRFDESKSLNTILSELKIMYKKGKFPFPKEIENEEDKKRYFLEFIENLKEKFERNEFSSSKDPIDQISTTSEDEIKLESLKISYELTHEILGEEYFNDSLCEVFRKYLVKGKLDSDFEKKIYFKGITESIKNANDFHYFALIKIDNILFSSVILYNTFISIFIVSEDASKYNLKGSLYEIFNESND